MKIFHVLIIITLFMMAMMTGCEYDVTQPLWHQDFEEPPTPVIIQIEPAQAATPGVNLITIHGENFAEPPDTSKVYFGTVAAEIASASSTTIAVRRPNLAIDSCTVKVISNQALVVAKYSPYTIDPVINRYGSFLDNVALGVVAIDHAENLYVVETSSRNIVKVMPDGQQTTLGQASRAPSDGSIGPDGRLYLLGSNRAIDTVNVETGEVEQWTRLPSGKVVKFGDFDDNGYFYTGGKRTDLVIVAPDPDLTVTYANFYGSDEILAIRVFNEYVYVAVRAGTDIPAFIYKHRLDANGTVGDQELVFDMSTAGEFSLRTIMGITLSSDGTIYLATDASNPLLIVDSAIDIFYKGIIPPYCKHFSWGNGNYLYLISGDVAAEQEWLVYRIDMGTTGSP